MNIIQVDHRVTVYRLESEEHLMVADSNQTEH